MSDSEVKKRIVIGIPGSSFSTSFLLSWTRCLYALWESHKYDVVIAPGTSSFVSFARMKTMGLDVLRGKDQKPFNGMQYDVFVTLDSDMVFTADQLIELIENTDTHPVVAGVYMMADCTHLAVVRDWDIPYFTEHGTFKFMTPDELADIKKITTANFIPVSYVGMGFMAMRKEVLDSLSYPYFHSDLQRMTKSDGTEIVEMCSEDVSLCKNIQAAGYTIYINTNMRVGHCKEVVI